jgi:hypothetical protein
MLFPQARLRLFATPVAHGTLLLINLSVQVNEPTLKTDSFSVQIKFAFWLVRNWPNDIRCLILHSNSSRFLFWLLH